MPAILYKLTLGDHWYIGSTTGSLKSRIAVHRCYTTRYPERKLYKHIVGAGGWGAVKCEVLQTVDEPTLEKLRRLETEHIRLDDPLCLNMHRAFTTDEERAAAARTYSARTYAKHKEDPVYMEQQRAKQRELYLAKREDPEFVAQNRARALAHYYRRKATVAPAGVEQDLAQE